MNKNRMLPTGFVLGLLFLTNSCTKEEQQDSWFSGLSFIASIETTQSSAQSSTHPTTRIATDNDIQTFTPGDRIGLYAVAYENNGGMEKPRPLTSTLNSADNALYIAEQSNGSVLFNSQNPIRFPSGTIKKLDVFAYYPFLESGFLNATTQLPVSVQPDQSTAANFWKSDFMTAEEANVTPQRATTADAQNRLKFIFSHRFALVYFEVKQGIEFNSLAELGTPTIKVTNLATQALFDWTNPASPLTPVETSTPNEITPNGELKKNSEQATVLSGMTALLIPQAISKETTVCKVEAAGMTFHCKLANDLTLKEGKSYTFTLTLNKSEISAINSVISDWKTSHIRGNITPDYPEIID